MLQSIVSFAADSALNQWIVSEYWLWPVLEIFHFIGLSLLFGGLIVIDLRLAGYFRILNPSATHKLLPLVLIGFTLNFITGILFFYGDPATYAYNAVFQLKMMLILLAGLNAMLYYWKLHPVMNAWNADTISPPIAKAVAYTSLSVWTIVLLCGRLIPFIGEYSGSGN
ncbi:MAG: hypothetical protein Q8L60_05490 [Gammaproteobacteria bacterium]|nr:hypothetical protein [Gammaproteobacteria bacterium]MDP2140546.1 hypothetical protein [Gammaproteobacteria bacterium]MDP2347315.1 hypothetical protein [Gammaproteobacteria bacterium]